MSFGMTGFAAKAHLLFQAVHLLRTQVGGQSSPKLFPFYSHLLSKPLLDFLHPLKVDRQNRSNLICCRVVERKDFLYLLNKMSFFLHRLPHIGDAMPGPVSIGQHPDHDADQQGREQQEEGFALIRIHSAKIE
jgi:hypothetical protein